MPCGIPASADTLNDCRLKSADHRADRRLKSRRDHRPARARQPTTSDSVLGEGWLRKPLYSGLWTGLPFPIDKLI
jgi:hypothetical protein